VLFNLGICGDSVGIGMLIYGICDGLVDIIDGVVSSYDYNYKLAIQCTLHTAFE